MVLAHPLFTFCAHSSTLPHPLPGIISHIISLPGTISHREELDGCLWEMVYVNLSVLSFQACYYSPYFYRYHQSFQNISLSLSLSLCECDKLLYNIKIIFTVHMLCRKHKGGFVVNCSEHTKNM